jgi:hypothetical protein
MAGERTEVVSDDDVRVEWVARDRLPQEHSALWFLGLGGIAASLIAYAIWSLNFLFAAFVFLAAIALALAAARPPIHHTIRITDTGIEIEGLPRRPFTEIESFWIFRDTAPPILALKPRRKISMPTYLLLEHVDVEKVREVLLSHIPEEEEEFPFIERVSRWLGL